MIEFFGLNERGRDFVVGDIHGCFSALKQQLDDIGFDPTKDRLFACGDLVDRGPESHLVLEWLSYPWFFSVQGNHDDWAVQAGASGPTEVHLSNGGEWINEMSNDDRLAVARRLAQLPLAIEVQTKTGTIGIVHAEVPWNDWSRFKSALQLHHVDSNLIVFAQWSRTKIRSADFTPVEHIDRVYVGHTVVREMCVLGNVYCLDTGHVYTGAPFAIVEL